MIGNATGKILTIFACVAACLQFSTQAQTVPPSEYEVKAAFLFNFAKFVDWPRQSFPETNSPIRIGVMGEDPFGADLEKTILNKHINGHSFAITRSKNIQELKNCHVLFIAASEKRRLAEILAAVGSLSILTVSDIDQFGPQGGIVQFTMEGDKVRFKINAKAAERVQLRISSKLLNLSQ